MDHRRAVHDAIRGAGKDLEGDQDSGRLGLLKSI